MVPKITTSSPETPFKGPTAQRSTPSPIDWTVKSNELPKDGGEVEVTASESARAAELRAKFEARQKESEARRAKFEKQDTPRLDRKDLNGCSAANPIGRSLAAPLSSETPAQGTPVINFDPSKIA